MNVLWLFAHPEPRSLSGELRKDAVAALERAGHQVVVSDLYAMGWNPVVTAADYGHDPAERFQVGKVSAEALSAGTLSADVRAEQAKVEAADTLIVQFPLWWYGMPAILKGWFDRVFLKGFAYGVPDPDHPGRTLRYGEGALAGKRALVVTTAGGRDAALGPRGVNGHIDELLFPLQHGTLWYVGYDVLPPVVFTGANRVSAEEYALAVKDLRERVLASPVTSPIPFWTQSGGDYDDDLVLHDHHASGRTGLGVHIRSAQPWQHKRRPAPRHSRSSPRTGSRSRRWPASSRRRRSCPSRTNWIRCTARSRWSCGRRWPSSASSGSSFRRSTAAWAWA